MARYSGGLAKLDETLGSFTSVLIWLLMVLVCFAVVLRYGFAVGHVALQEVQIYLHAFVFMMGMGYALKKDAHVRVDVFYQRFNSTQRAWINLTGGVCFLVPLCGLMFYLCWDYVVLSWANKEQSREAGGLPFVYLLKSLLLLFPITLALSALREIIAASITLFQAPRQSVV